jgi:hypothetical protein
MVLTWFMGVQGLNFGFSTASRIRAGTMPDVSSIGVHAATLADVIEYGALCALRATLANPRVTFPLAIAELILSGLLVVASGLAMGGRKGARGLALQAILVNAAFAIAAFLLTPFIRAAAIDGMLRALDTLALQPPEREALPSVGSYQWAWRVSLICQLGALALGAFALTRARTKTYFDTVARAPESTDDS